jgi:hypothetical protein
VRQDAIQLAARVAALRIVNDRLNLELRLKDFPIGIMRTTTPDPSEIADLAIRRSVTAMTSGELEALISEELPNCISGGEAAVGDHDFFKALARVLKDYGVRTSDETLASSFLAAVSCGHIMQTSWYEELKMWAKVNDRDGFDCPHAA